MAHLRERLTALVENPYLPPARREFAESLLVYYNQKKRLTAGRRQWVDRLEVMAIENEANKDKANDLLPEIDTVLKRIVDHSSWDYGFAESLKEQVEAGRTLSPRQIELFSQIKERNSEQAVAEHTSWVFEYRDNHQADAMIVAKYYDRTPYWKQHVHRFLNNPEFVPSKSLFNKIVKNKYAQRVLEESKRAPRYEPGASVIVRGGTARAEYHIYKKLSNGGVVLKVFEEVYTAAKGGKLYLVLPYGSAEPVEVEERRIKKYRRPKKKKKS